MMWHILIKDPLDEEHKYLVFRVVSEYIILIDDIGFPSKVAGVTMVGVYPLVFVGVGTGNGLDPFARVSTSEAWSVSSK